MQLSTAPACALAHIYDAYMDYGGQQPYQPHIVRHKPYTPSCDTSAQMYQCCVIQAPAYKKKLIAQFRGAAPADCIAAIW